jgi:hypothetical protein
VWLFADDKKLHGKRILAKFDDHEIRESTNGNEFPVFRFVGSTGEWAGELLLSVWRTDYTAAVETYGDETDNWKGKMFYIEQAGGKMKVYPADEALPEEKPTA